MLNDAEICSLLQQQYDGEQFDATIDISGVYCSVKHYPDCSVVMFRGSTTPLDFWRDFQGLMVQDADLGGVEQGFITGIRDIKAHLDNIDTEHHTIIAGHSLGAARALLFAALANTDVNHCIESVITFGAPRPGGQKLKNILAPVMIRSYKNAGDPVADVPIDIPLIEPYCEPREFTVLYEPPQPNDPWGIVAPHHLQLYQAGVSKLCATSPSI